ncbi:toxin [Methylocystis heyeri]|uniref:Toxin n=1 Tax=Methylocystis heyeri TaxID=391905 RepID=A0A6B8KF78_9HYPH|nr:toxin [Methylocystis heyeri]QGM47134.1 toxin [Methylocystis heyeri]
MAQLYGAAARYHEATDIAAVIGAQYPARNAGQWPPLWGYWSYSFDFANFYHPWVGELITRLNQTSVQGMLNAAFLKGLRADYSLQEYTPNPANRASLAVTLEPRAIDVSVGGPYAVYNWELLYHLPIAVAVHLSNNQRFAEAQKWFHLVFDPTNTDKNLSAPQRFWTSFVFNGSGVPTNLQTLLDLLDATDPALAAAKQDVIASYDAIMKRPFDPFVVARNRPSAFQWYVVMKYLDNLIAWGDSLFLQDTIETINEATLCYVLAANLLGEKPQTMPQPGRRSAKNFLQLQQAGLDAMSNALIDLEAQFPFNLAPAPSPGGDGVDMSGALFGIGRALYFCIPRNKTLLGYWDIVADRLFKIRNSENIQGVFQQLPLFDPPLDPGMLVKAAAAGIDIAGVVAGLNQPLGPMRSPYLVQKALELAGEVRALGSALLSALEKGENEKLALLRQTHEIALQTLVQNARFLQWKHAEESTNALLKSRASAYERYKNYLRLLGQAPDGANAPENLSLDRSTITEAAFDDLYAKLVEAYDRSVPMQTPGKLKMAQGSSPASGSGASGDGQLYLIDKEDAELNSHLPTARDTRVGSGVANTIAGTLMPIPSVEAHLAFWGIGMHSKIVSGQILAAVPKLVAEGLQIAAGHEGDQAGIASRTASYQRRADDWKHQGNVAARELMSIGRQIIGSLIAEQAAKREYENVKTQIQQAQEVQSFLETKFADAQFYDWMGGELSGRYYQYYRFACDTARRAEQTMKRELMRPELDATQFIRFDYWDSGHQGLLSGEALHFDLKRLEMAYHDNNRRELEMIRHVSLRQLDPLALIQLRVTGSCTVAIPEWLYDRDCPGHYMRRIKTVALSIPSVVGPYSSVNCTLSLLASSVRVSPLLANGAYGRDPAQDDPRFVDYFGATDVVVTSGASNDSGMFEANLHDERFLPFEGAGAIGTWRLALPPELRSFDYSTISDSILHIRYTARQGGDPLGATATKELKKLFADQARSPQALILNLKYDFPTEWAAFVNAAGQNPFAATIDRSFLPYFLQGMTKTIVVGNVRAFCDVGGVAAQVGVPAATALHGKLTDAAGAQLTLPIDPKVIVKDPQRQVYVVIGYACS